MDGHARTYSAGTMLLGALLVGLGVDPGEVAGRRAPQQAASSQRTAELGRTLGADGSFKGAAGVAGTVDTSAWTLVSDLAAGEAPRFAPISSAVSPSAAGPWSALGSNGSGDGALNGFVVDLEVAGSDTYAGGVFSDPAGNVKADYVAKFNGSVWSALGSNPAGTNGALDNSVRTVAVSGTDLYVGGYFTNAAGIPAADGIAKWNGLNWSAVGNGLQGIVIEIEVSGTDVYAGGSFLNAGGIATADHIAKWNGSAWSALGATRRGGRVLNGWVTALEASGPDLYVGGQFTNANNARADYLARWDGTNWHPLGSNGAGTDGALTAPVDALAVSGTDLYVGGSFNDAAGIPEADYLAKWNGSGWSALGSNNSGNGALNDDVEALAVYGSDLYAGGYFFDAAGDPKADGIAKWNGAAWSALGSNGAGDGALGGDHDVYTLAISGTDLYVGGDFENAGNVGAADDIAKWPLGAKPRQPDGRIRLGTGGFVGNDIYNTTGAGQTRTGSAALGGSITFGISIQDDGANTDRYMVKATGAATSAYSVKYFRGTTDITAAVVAGTYQTPALAPGGTYLITARVTVKSTAAVGTQVTRLVTITSVGNSARKDAVKLIGKRA